MTDINKFWGAKLAEPEARTIEIEGLFPPMCADKEGNLWVFEASVQEPLPGEEDKWFLWARYSRFNEKTGALEGVIDTVIPKWDWDKLKDHDYMNGIMENIRARIEDKNREAKEQAKNPVMVNQYKSVKRGH